MGRGTKQTLLLRRHTNGQQMFNFTSYYGSTNQNYNDATSYLLEWLLATRQVVTSIGEAVDKKEPSFTAGGNVNWYSHYGKQYGGSSKI